MSDWFKKKFPRTNEKKISCWVSLAWIGNLHVASTLPKVTTQGDPPIPTSKLQLGVPFSVNCAAILQMIQKIGSASSHLGSFPSLTLNATTDREMPIHRQTGLCTVSELPLLEIIVKMLFGKRTTLEEFRDENYLQRQVEHNCKSSETKCLHSSNKQNKMESRRVRASSTLGWLSTGMYWSRSCPCIGERLVWWSSHHNVATWNETVFCHWGGFCNRSGDASSTNIQQDEMKHLWSCREAFGGINKKYENVVFGYI